MKTWKPTTAGVLSIASGAFIVWYRMSEFFRAKPSSGIWSDWHAFSLIGPVIGIIAIVGGIYALKRQRWGLALAGAICAIVPPHPWGVEISTPILGILAVIFVVKSRNEFSSYSRNKKSITS